MSNWCRPRFTPLAVEVVDLADPLRFEDALHHGDGRVVDEGVADHERLAGALARADDRFGVAHRLGERLLDENVLSAANASSASFRCVPTGVTTQIASMDGSSMISR